MSFLIRRPWDSQPPDGTRIDVASPFSAQLQFALLPGVRSTNALTGAGPQTISGASPYRVRPAVQGREYNSSFERFSLPSLPTLTAATIWLRVVPTTSVDNYYSPFQLGGDGLDVNNSVSIERFNGGSDIKLYTKNSAGSRSDFSFTNVNSSWLTAGTVNDICVVFGNGNIAAYINGVAGLAPTTAYSALLLPTHFGLGHSWSANYNGLIGPAFFWNRALSVSEVLQLNSNPWQVFEPRRIFVPMAGASSGIPTLSAATVFNITATTARPRVTVTF